MLVVGLWLWGAFRSGRDDVDTGQARVEHGDDSRLGRRFVIGGGIVMPAVIMAGFFGVQLVTTAAQSQAEGELVVEVTGHQYWWQLDYSGIDGVEDFATANEVHVPTGTEVKVKLRSDDVIHSFWVPQLAGKVDLVPGRPAEFVLQADEPGTYPGYCAEYCGLQHAWMKFEVVAQQPDDFRTWAEQQAEDAAEPTAEPARPRPGRLRGPELRGLPHDPRRRGRGRVRPRPDPPGIPRAHRRRDPAPDRGRPARLGRQRPDDQARRADAARSSWTARTSTPSSRTC